MDGPNGRFKWTVKMDGENRRVWIRIPGLKELEYRNCRHLSILSELCIFNTFSAADIVYKAIIRDIPTLPYIPVIERLGQKVNFCSIIAFSLILIIETIRGTYALRRKDERKYISLLLILTHDGIPTIPTSMIHTIWVILYG